MSSRYSGGACIYIISVSIYVLHMSIYIWLCVCVCVRVCVVGVPHLLSSHSHSTVQKSTARRPEARHIAVPERKVQDSTCHSHALTHYRIRCVSRDSVEISPRSGAIVTELFDTHRKMWRTRTCGWRSNVPRKQAGVECGKDVNIREAKGVPAIAREQVERLRPSETA